jgi:DNA-binding HxlR family transcriptional regulator
VFDIDCFECPIMAAIAMISDKWKVLIIYRLCDGTMRFNELMRSLQGITQRVLTQQLRELEADGLVSRKIYAEVPPRVEYSLTKLGRTLLPALEKLEQWARKNSSQLIAARHKAIEQNSKLKSRVS